MEFFLWSIGPLAGSDQTSLCPRQEQTWNSPMTYVPLYMLSVLYSQCSVTGILGSHSQSAQRLIKLLCLFFYYHFLFFWTFYCTLFSFSLILLVTKMLELAPCRILYLLTMWRQMWPRSVFRLLSEVLHSEKKTKKNHH